MEVAHFFQGLGVREYDVGYQEPIWVRENYRTEIIRTTTHPLKISRPSWAGGGSVNGCPGMFYGCPCGNGESGEAWKIEGLLR